MGILPDHVGLAGTRREIRELLALQPAIRIDELNPPKLSQERSLRMSYLIGIYRAWHVLDGEKLADKWVKLLNTNVMFCGQAPLIYMILGLSEPCVICGSCSTRVAPETDEMAPLLKPTGEISNSLWNFEEVADDRRSCVDSGVSYRA